MKLIHAKIVNLRHEVQHIPFIDGPTLIPKDNGADGLNRGDDRIQHEDKRPSLEVIDRLRIVFKQHDLLIRDQVAEFELVGEV